MVLRQQEETGITTEIVFRHNPGLFMGPLASENQLLMLGLAVENTEQKNQLFGWNTD